jgi:pimeloyl-ACP methyl ester carboxylesterase
MKVKADSRWRRRPSDWQREPPSALLLALEGRAIFEWSALLLAWPWLGRAPHGDGHPVLVLPGLLASDASTLPIRGLLDRLGFVSHPWELGMNRGPVKGVIGKLSKRVRDISKQSGRKVSLVGWSMGGAMAHGLALAMPDRVRSVITMGSPLDGHPHSTNAWRVFEQVSGLQADDEQLHDLMGLPALVPTTNILSKSDGIVHWRSSMLPPSALSETIEVSASHLGLGVHPAVLWMIAERLAQAEGAWRPFVRSGSWRRFWFRDPRQLRIDDLYARAQRRVTGAAVARADTAEPGSDSVRDDHRNGGD